jgi:3-hydroxyacyl-CoA dehydrogenase
VPPESQPNDSRTLTTTELPATIALIGATPLAEQMASRALNAGHRVIIDDISDARLQTTSRNLRVGVRAQDSCAPGPHDHSDSPQSDLSFFGDVPNAPNSRSSHLSLTQSIDSAIRSADFLIDALPDDLEVKLELFTLFDKFAKPNSIFITTGSIPIDDLAEITFCPDRCIAIRLAPSANDAETSFALIPGKQTSPQTLAKCTTLFLNSLAFRAA